MHWKNTVYDFRAKAPACPCVNFLRLTFRPPSSFFPSPLSLSLFPSPASFLRLCAAVAVVLVYSPTFPLLFFPCIALPDNSFCPRSTLQGERLRRLFARRLRYAARARGRRCCRCDRPRLKKMMLWGRREEEGLAFLCCSFSLFCRPLLSLSFLFPLSPPVTSLSPSLSLHCAFYTVSTAVLPQSKSVSCLPAMSRPLTCGPLLPPRWSLSLDPTRRRSRSAAT